MTAVALFQNLHKYDTGLVVTCMALCLSAHCREAPAFTCKYCSGQELTSTGR